MLLGLIQYLIRVFNGLVLDSIESYLYIQQHAVAWVTWSGAYWFDVRIVYVPNWFVMHLFCLYSSIHNANQLGHIICLDFNRQKRFSRSLKLGGITLISEIE